jgi:predicted ATPase/DNA-binding XRE family transcriptional regulator
MADSFGELLRSFRIAASLTQEALAERCRISPNTIAALEQGRRRGPRLSTVRLLADALELSANDRERLAVAARTGGAAVGTGGATVGTGDQAHPSPPAGAVDSPAVFSRPAPLSRPSAFPFQPPPAPRADPAAASAGAGGHGGPPWRTARPRPMSRPAASRPVRAGMLPVPITPLFGRYAQAAAVGQEVVSERLVTLVGPGGVGKSRLAVEVASSLLDKFPGGTYWAELGQVSDPGSVRGTVLRSLEAAEQPGVPLADQLLAALPGERALLVIDNCEHVLDSAAAMIAEVLAHPLTVVLATSREPLAIPGEVRWAVPALIVPPDSGPPTAESVMSIDSVQLFIERAGRANPRFTLTDAEAAPIARICRRLEGIPLAIELAAACVATRGPGQLADELDAEIPLTAAAARGVPRRQATLRASIDWSYRLLTAEDQAAFRCLGCFAGSFTAAAFAAVTSRMLSSGSAAAMDGALYRLADKSLVSADGRSGRYRVLDTIRGFAADQARALGELPALRDAHAGYYAAWLAGLNTADATDDVLDLIDADYPNLCAAVSWSVETGSPRAPSIVADIGVAWQERSHFHDARVLGDAALRIAADTDRDLWARAVGSLAMARLLGSTDFLPTVAEALVVATAAGDHRTEGICRLALGSRPPFDSAQLLRAHELGAAGSFRILATLGAIWFAYGGTERHREDWLRRADERGASLANSTLSAARRLAWADSLLERGLLGQAVEIAEPAVFDPRVMPTTRLLGVGRTLLVALHQRDLELAGLADAMSQDLAHTWPVGISWLTSSWTAFGGLLQMWLALLRGEQPPPVDVGVLGRSTRMALTPSVVRTVCRAAMDRGDFLDPASVAHAAEPPAGGSLMAASFAAVHAARAMADGETTLAEQRWADVLSVAVPSEYLLLVCDALEGLGALASQGGDAARGRLLLGAAARCRDDIGYVFRFGFEQEHIDRAWAVSGPAPRHQPALTWQAAAEAALSHS